MALKINFNNLLTKYPSGSGLSNEPCPNCNASYYTMQYGMGDDGEFYFKHYCFKCKWSRNNCDNKELGEEKDD